MEIQKKEMQYWNAPGLDLTELFPWAWGVGGGDTGAWWGLVGLVWAWLGELTCIGMGWLGLDWAGLGWVGLGCIYLNFQQ